MLKSMRDSFHHLRWILLAVVVAFVFGFVFIDMGLGGAAAGADNAASAYAARVNGETISFNDYRRALQNIEGNYRQMYGSQWSPELAEAMGLPRQVLDSLVDQRLLLQEAERLHLAATQEEVRRKILEIPALKNADGSFVGTELYTRFVTGPLGYPSAAAFEEDLAREITLQKMESALASSIVISPKAAEVEYRRTSENAKIRYILYPSNREAANVQVNEAEVANYYKTNQARYAHAEQRQIKYLLADYGRLRSMIVPDEADLRRRYEASKSQYKSPEAAHVLHILVKVDPGAAPEVDAAARTEAQTIVAQLRGGADFAALAKQHSDDQSSAGRGGDMQWVEKGQTVEEFETAIFSLPLNQISDPIRTKDFGYHIVKVLERRTENYRPFEEVKNELAAKVADDTAKEQAREAINAIATRVKSNKPKSEQEFTSLANDRVTANASEWFAKGDSIPGIGFNAPLVNWAFTVNAGDVGDVIGTQRGMVIPYISAVRPAGVTALAEIKAKVESDAKNEKAKVIARDALAQAAAGAGTLEQVATKVGLAATETTVTRQGFISGFQGDTSALVEAAMAAPVGERRGPIVVGDGAVLFEVAEQKRVDAKEIEENRASFTDMIRQQQSRNLRQVLLQRLKKSAKVVVNDELIKTAAAQAGA